MNEEHERIRQLIDACRPDHDDVSAPEFQLLAERIDGDERLREQFERSQQFDRALTTAFQDVDVPQGLANRLLDAVSAGDIALSGGPPWRAAGGGGLGQRWLGSVALPPPFC